MRQSKRNFYSGGTGVVFLALSLLALTGCSGTASEVGSIPEPVAHIAAENVLDLGKGHVDMLANSSQTQPTGKVLGDAVEDRKAPVFHTFAETEEVEVQRFSATDSRILFLDNPATTPATASGGQDLNKLAKDLQNPVASLISVPFQSNFGFRAGPTLGGWQYLLNFQPVIPISLNKDWNLISRTIVPVIYQNDMFEGSDQGGLGDIDESLFLSPQKPGPGNIIWGVGPILLFPTATDDFLGAHRWGLGPTGVILRQDGPWTYGILANQIWSLGNRSKFENGQAIPAVDSTFLQPFLAYSLGHGASLNLNTESTYNWISHQWTVPVFLGASQIIPIHGQLVNFQFGPRVYVEGHNGTPEWGLRFNVTFLFPK